MLSLFCSQTLPLERRKSFSFSFDHGSHNVSRWMTWLPISLKNAAKCDKWYQLQNHLITESLNANGARVEAFLVNTGHAALSVVQKPKEILFSYEDSFSLLPFSFTRKRKRGGDHFCAGLCRRNKCVKRISGCRRSLLFFSQEKTRAGARGLSKICLGLFDFVCPGIFGRISDRIKKQKSLRSLFLFGSHKSRNNTNALMECHKVT